MKYSHLHGLTYPTPSEEILEKKIFVYMPSIQWISEFRKVLTKSPHFSFLCMKPESSVLDKILTENPGTNYSYKKYPQISKKQLNQKRKKPNMKLEKALEMRYIQKFKFHFDGSSLDLSSSSKAWSYGKSISHSAHMTNLHYAGLSLGSKPRQDGSSDHKPGSDNSV